MALRIEGLDQKIMLSAQEEFLEYGYKDASINRIAQKAGVTSGAIYIRYKNKDEIFCSLVKTVVDGIDEKLLFYDGRYTILGKSKSWEKISELDSEVFNWLIDYIFENYDKFKLLICKAEGSSISGFVRKLVDFKFQKTYDFIQNILLPLVQVGEDKIEIPVTKEEIALLSCAQYESLFEVIRHGYEKTEAKKYLTTVRRVYGIGLKKILEDFLNSVKE
jgi:AcrR family transcriptional regulator